MSNMRWIALWIVVSVCLMDRPAWAGGGTFEQGVFRFRVAIDDSIAPAGVAKAEEAFQAASNLLHGLTGGRHVFGEVLVCKSSAKQIADFWVTKKFRSRATIGGYGQPGQHVILNLDDISDVVTGPALIVHEFAHHAYGLYDEYVGPRPQDITGPWDPANPPFQSDKPAHAYNWHLTVCINDYLALTPEEQLAADAPMHSCLTPLASGHQPGQPLCIMENFLCASKYGATGFTFCNSSNHELHANPAQTWQQFVHGASCWSTIHASPYPLGAFFPPATSFQWVLTGDARRYILVIDKSGSMSGTKITLAKKGAKIFVNPMTPEDEIGVVAFDGSATEIVGLGAMTTKQKIDAKVKVNDLAAGGSTDIGNGLQMALDMLTNAGGDFCNRAILLLSDGLDSVPTQEIAALQAQQIPVCAIALGTGVDEELMQQIALETGGVFLRVVDESDLANLFAKHAAWIKQQGVFQDTEGLLISGSTKKVGASVDASTGTASFIVSWDGADEAVQVILKNPDGDEFEHPGSGDIDTFEDDGSVTFVAKGDAMEKGKWKAELLCNQGPTTYSFIGLSDNPYVAFAASSDQSKYTWPKPMKVTATARFGSALTGIEIDGVVVRPDGSETEIVLRDDGSAASGDVRKNDGVYSAWFSSWNKGGAYTVKLVARANKKAQPIATEHFGMLPKNDPEVEKIKRYIEFSVLASGVPPISLHNFAVKSLNIDVHSNFDVENSLAIVGIIDLDPWSVDPEHDTLVVDVGGAHFEIPAPAMSTFGGDHNYTFDTGSKGAFGYIDLFQDGSSFGKFKLKVGSLKASVVGPLSPIDCRFRYGTMDETVTIKPKIGADLVSASFTDTSPTLSPLYFVTSAKVEIKNKKSGKDKLSMRAKVHGGYKPKAATTVIALGSFSISIDPTTWKVSGGGATFTHESTAGGAKVSVVYDKEHHELSIKGNKLDLAGVSSPVITSITSDTYHETHEIHLSTEDKGSAVLYIY